MPVRLVRSVEAVQGMEPLVVEQTPAGPDGHAADEGRGIRQPGHAILGAVLFPVGFILLYLLGYDLLTGMFVLGPLAWLDKRPGVTVRGVHSCL